MRAAVTREKIMFGGGRCRTESRAVGRGKKKEKGRKREWVRGGLC